MPRFSSQNSATPAQSAGSRWFREIASAITSVVFPAGCRICEKILASSSRIPICEACLSSFTTITEINCEICGRPSETGLVNSAADPNLPPRPTRCHDCLDLDCPRFAFQRARSWALYHEALISAILLLKFERIQPLGYFFAERLAEMICSNAAALEAISSCPSLCIALASVPAAIIRRTYLPGRWPASCAFPINPFCWLEFCRVRKLTCSPIKSAGPPCVELLPHVQAPKLTIYASYW